MTTPKTATLTVKLSQQSVSLLKQIISAVGWAESVSHIFEGGKLLGEGGLPSIDSTDWIKPNEEIAKMSKDEREAYLAIDKAWGDKQYEITLTAKQVETIEHAFKTITKKQALAPNRYWVEVIEQLGIKVD